jgi:glycerol-3-phosphate cytidylyltransferase
MKRVITFGTYDVFHIGHVNILERAAALGDYLIVGVSSDALSYKKKHRYPLYSQDDRVKIISSMRCVDEVFIEESLEDKARYIEMKKADLLVMGMIGKAASIGSNLGAKLSICQERLRYLRQKLSKSPACVNGGK